MKKVLMVVPSFSAKGGITSVVNGYKNHLEDDDYKVKFIETYCDGIKTRKIMKFIAGYIKFITMLLFWKPQIVHIHSSFGASFKRKSIIINTSYFFKKRIINHVHGADFLEFYEKASNKKRKNIEKIYNRCNKLIALSNEWKEKLSKIVPENKIAIIENYAIIKEEKPKKHANLNVLFLGFLCERKGCFDIPYVVKQVKMDIPNIKFILAGSGTTKDELKLKRIIKEQKVEDNIILPGWVNGEKKNELLQNADIFFLPSYNEGMPMAILDAMGYSLPIVSTTVGGIERIVKNNYNGYTFEPRSIQDFSNSIIDIVSNNNLRIKMGKNSINIIKKGYTLECHIDKIKKIYKEI